MFIINCLYKLTNIWVEIWFIKKYGSVEFYLKAKLGQHVSPFPTLPLVNQEVILSFETLAMFQERSHQLINRSIGLSLINGYLRKMLLGSICIHSAASFHTLWAWCFKEGGMLQTFQGALVYTVMP